MATEEMEDQMAKAQGTGKATRNIIIGTTIAGAVFGAVVGGLVAIFGSPMPGVATFGAFVVLFLCIGIAKCTKLNAALRTPPETAAQFLQRSKSHIELTGDYAQAVADVSAAIDMDADCVEAYTWRALIVLSNEHDSARAASDLEAVSQRLASQRPNAKDSKANKSRADVYWAWYNFLKTEEKTGRSSHEPLAIRWMIEFLRAATDSSTSLMLRFKELAERIEKLHDSQLASHLVIAMAAYREECQKRISQSDASTPINYTESFWAGAKKGAAESDISQIKKLTQRMNKIKN